MKKLIITANPSSKAFTHALSREYQSLSEKRGDTVTLLDLYQTELRQDFLRYEDQGEIGRDPISLQIQSMISEADELVFIFPIWWGDMPAIMKNFFDINFRAGFGFKYENGKKIGLLTGKSARIIATSGAPSFFYKIILHIPLLWKMNRIGFCGIKQKSFTVFGEVGRSGTDTAKYLKSLEKLV